MKAPDDLTEELYAELVEAGNPNEGLVAKMTPTSGHAPPEVLSRVRWTTQRPYRCGYCGRTIYRPEQHGPECNGNR